MISVEQGISRCEHLACSNCGRIYPVEQINTFATCESCGKAPLVACYSTEGLRKTDIISEERSMWRYMPMLPVFDRRNIVSLGEGFTPILNLKSTADAFGLSSLVLKDEGLNPTGSFKARGMSMGISKAKELGIEKCIVPTAGNAGGAMAAYCAKAGMKAVVVMPRHTPNAFKNEVEMFGAELVLVDGLISDCGKKVREMNADGEYFDMSTMKEPYRLEGKKTMGYEIAEQLNWTLPDIILYPTGGGTGLIGMWKAFEEMIELGWIGTRLPRMIAVQAENCQPVVETWKGSQPDAASYKGKPTLANGLAVPNPFAEKMILRVLKESGGRPIGIAEGDIVEAQKEVGRREGLFIAPEGAALFVGLKKMIASNEIRTNEKILVLNTGSGYKYI
ncbi:MAG TPA: threonine synthase [Cyclobacteriaceae bacterium]|nr:threonine synthase [Cyclobacteriaceae bacterium]